MAEAPEPTKPGPRDERATRTPRGGWRATQLLLFGAIPAGLVLFLLFVQAVAARRDYLVERSHRDVELASRQIALRLEGLEAQCESGPSRTLRPTSLRFLQCPVATTPPFGIALDPTPASARLLVTCPGPSGAPVCGEYPLSKLLGGPLSFDEVVLAREDGQVLGQRTRAFGAVADLDDLPVPRTRPGVLPLLTFGSPQDDGSATERRKADGAAAGETAVTHWTRVHRDLEVILGGATFRVFCRPVRAAPDAPSIDLAVCGFRSQERLSAEAWELPPQFLAAALGILLVVLCTWPALRLRFMGQNERLRARDVGVLVVSCLAGVGIGTAAVAQLQAGWSLQSRLDREQARFGQELRARLAWELQRAKAQLAAFADAVEQQGVVAAGSPSPPPPRPPCALLGPVTYRFFSDLALLDEEGRILTVCTPAEGSTWLADAPAPRRSAAERAYVRDVHRGVLFLQDSAAGAAGGVAIESVRTKSTGAPAIALAMPVPRSIADASRAPIAVLAAQPQSVIAPVLPPGFGFAVIDRKGKVVLHADTRRNLVETLFDECDHPEALRAAVTSGQPRTLSSRCYGRNRHVLQTLPVRGTPWTLVTFRNLEPESGLRFAVLDFWAVAYTGYLLAAALVALLALRACGPGYRADWLWPSPEKGARYSRIAVLLVVVGALGMLGTTALGGWPRLILVALVPAIGLLVAKLGVGPVGQSAIASGRQERRSCARHHSSFVVALALVLGVVPAYGLFRDAWELGLETHVKRAQLAYAQALERRSAASRGLPLSACTVGPSGAAAGGEQACDVFWSDVLGGQPLPGASDAPADDVRHPLVFLTSIVPGLRDQTTWFSALGERTSEPEPNRWSTANARVTGPDAIDLLVDHGAILQRATRDARVRLHAEVPSLLAPDANSWRVALMAGLLWLALWTLVHATGKRLFLLDHRGTEPATPRVWTFALSSLDTFATGEGVDLARCPSVSDLQLRLRSGSPPFVLDHLESRLGDAGWAEALLAEVEALAKRGTPFVLVSEVDAVAFLGSQFGDSEPPEGSPARPVIDRFWRWTRLLGACARREDDPTALAAAAGKGRLATVLEAKGTALPAPVDAGDEHFWRIWSCSTRAEKLAMAHLALEGFLNPHAEEPLRQLCERGLVRRTPVLQLFAPDFREFVRQAESARDLRAWEQRDSTDWDKAQIPVFGALAVAGAFLFMTQPQLFQTGVGMAGAAATAVGGATSLIRFVSARPRGGPQAA